MSIEIKMKQLVLRFFNKFGYQIVPNTRYSALLSDAKDARVSSIVARFLPQTPLGQISEILQHSKSQLGQDVFALSTSRFKQGGFFVEFGATNGVSLSNTHILEKAFGWNGILAEPAKVWHSDLKKHRNCHVSTDCVWIESGKKLVFAEPKDAELSTIEHYRTGDLHADARAESKSYEVPTISLLDLLRKYEAPNYIDFLSVDTEGSELSILEAFNFSAYQFGAICVEHNHTANREKIQGLLEGEGYVRVLETVSDFDDWYINKNHWSL